jgi:hypothetical protein
MDQPRYKISTIDTTGISHRLAERNQAEIDAARAAGDHERAELLILRSVNYPEYVATVHRRLAMAEAARVAAVPLTER